MNAVLEEVFARRHRTTVAEYHRMGELGLFARDARMELITGEIIDMAPIGSRHAGRTSYLDRLLTQAVGDQAIVRTQQPLRLDDYSEPEPDLVLVRPRADFYDTGHPTAADALLIVEVSDTTLRYDRQVKAPLYAAHGVAEVWILDLKAEELHILRSPAAQGYQETSVTSTPGIMTLVALPDLTVDLSRLFV